MTGPAVSDSTREGTDADAALVDRVRSNPVGNSEAFEELVRRHRARVLSTCRRVTGQPDQAEDLAQEVLFKVHQGLTRFRGRSSFSTWLHRIAVNHCLDHLKSRRRRVCVDLDDPANALHMRLAVDATAERDLVTAEAYRRVTVALDAMPERLRVPLALREFDGRAYKDIGDVLDLSVGTVKMRVLRARRELRRQLIAYGPVDGQTRVAV